MKIPWRKRRDLKIHMLLNRGQRAHSLFVSMVLAMLLYIPVSYLINTNLDVHRDISQTYGIEYSCHVENDKALAQSLQEYNTLAAQCSDVSSMVYVQQTVMVRIYREALSGELIKALKAAGWSEEEFWENQATLVFLEDSIYDEWMKVLDADNGQNNPLYGMWTMRYSIHKYGGRTMLCSRMKQSRPCS